MIPKETIDDIFDSTRIEEVVGDFVTLKKRGVNLLGNCPFHDEKTPSFTVSPSKGIFKCFGCGKGGNSVNFVMEHEQFSYPEALKYLAKKYNIEIIEQEQTPEQIEKANARESLFVVNTYAKDYFTEQLKNSQEGKAIGLSYFKERGVSLEMIEKFQLGYNPEGWDSFSKTAQGKGYKIEFLEKTGLTIVKEDKQFDRFRGRIMFPIHSMSGRVIGFGGRILKKSDKAAKYLNSPESEIYHKSKVLYGIYFSKSAIVKQDNCFLVEGYTDVISLHQHGVENVVASSGTALTKEQINLISRFSKNITILFDGDAAGIKASFRGIDLILAEGMNVKVVLFPEGEDPDSYAKVLGKEKIQQFIEDDAQDFLTFKTNLLKDESKDDPIKKVNLIKEVVSSIAVIPDEITRAVYINECSKLLGIGEKEILNKIGQLKQQSRKNTYTKGEEKKPELTPFKATPLSSHTNFQEKDIIRFLLQYGNEKIQIDDNEVFVAQFIITELNNEIEFSNPSFGVIFNAYYEDMKKGQLLQLEFFTQHKDPAVSQLVVDIISSPHSISKRWKDHGIYTQTEDMQLKPAVETAIYSLKVAKIGEQIQTKNKQLNNETSSDNELKLLSEINELTKLKKEISAKLGRTILK